MIERLRSRFRAHVLHRYPESVMVSKRWERAAAAILFPRVWSPPRQWEIDYAINELGLTEADLRDCYARFDRDAVVLRCHNGRRFEVTGLEMIKYKSRLISYGKIDPAKRDRQFKLTDVSWP